MMVGNEIQIFNSSEFGSVRVLVSEDGTILFSASEVAKALGYSNDRDAISRHCRCVVKRDVPHPQNPEKTFRVNFIPEADLYRLIFSSKLESAQKFERWVVEDVLPSIRKHGAYMTPDVLVRTITDPDFMIGLLQELKAEQERSRILAEQNTELKDKNSELSSRNTTLKLQRLRDAKKVQFADAVTASNSHILVGALAKILKQNGFDIGQNRLFKWLRDNDYLIKHGQDYNMPTQRAMEKGLFFVKEVKVDMGDKGVSIKRTPMITGKGQQYFINLFLSDSEEEE